MRRLLVGTFFCLAACGPGAAADINVGGWMVNRAPSADGVCLATYSYRDKRDGNKESGVAFGVKKVPDNTALIISVARDGWDFAKDSDVEADLLGDGRTIVNKAKWKAADTTNLALAFPNGSDLFLTVGTSRVLTFKLPAVGKADFKVPNAGLAIGALLVCLNPPETTATAPAPEPPKVEINPEIGTKSAQ